MTWTAPSRLTDAYETAVLADTPKGFWHLDSIFDGVNTADASGNSHTLAVNGGVSVSQAGARSLAQTFDGTTGYLNVPDHADFDLTDTFTLEAWVKTSTSGTVKSIIDKGSTAYKLDLGTTNLIRLSKQGTAVIVSSTTAVPSDGTWHHVVATKSGATVKLYLDAVDVTGTVTNQTCANNANELRIGQSTAGGEFFNGSLDEVAVYATALSSARVSAHYTTTATGALTSTAYNVNADDLTYLWTANALGVFTPSDDLGAVCHPTLNGAVMAPAICRTPITVSKIAYRNNTANGQVDVGIYTDNGDQQTIAVVRTSGLTAMPGVGNASTSINLSSPVALTPFTKYWLVIGFTNTNAAIMGTDGPYQTLCRKAVNCMPLPTTISFNSPAPSASPCLAALA